jgi:hypothetical protein
MGNLGGGLRAVDWQSQTLAKFEKNFYVEDKRVSARSDREVDEFRRAKEMKVSSSLAIISLAVDEIFLGPGSRSPEAHHCIR